MRIAVTGAAGHLGRLTIGDLIKRGVDPTDIVGIVRSRERAEELTDFRIATAVAPYDDQVALDQALSGVDRLILISSSEVGQRTQQHRNIIDAAKRAGVDLILYTSLLNAPTSAMSLAEEHRATEEALSASGIPFVLLRNGWYWENFQSAVDTARTTGHIYGAAGDGKISGAARKDYAEAAAAVATSEDPAGMVYELAGPALTNADIAAAVAEVLGREVSYVNLSEEEYAASLVAAGMPEPVAHMLAGWDTAISAGALYSEDSSLSDLIGHQPTSISAVLTA